MCERALRPVLDNEAQNLEMLATVWRDTETTLQFAIPSPSLLGVNAGFAPNENPADVKKVPDMPL